MSQRAEPIYGGWLLVFVGALTTIMSRVVDEPSALHPGLALTLVGFVAALWRRSFIVSLGGSLINTGIVLIVAAAMAGPSLGSSAEAWSGPTLPAVASTPPAVTLAEYRRLTYGMPYEHAMAVIGEPGQEVSRMRVGEVTAVVYAWRNANGSNMKAVFENERLASGAQFGLP